VNNKPAPAIHVGNWRPCGKGTLVAFFDIYLPSGLILRHAMYHEQGSARWIQCASREWLDPRGVRQFAPLIEFATRDCSERFKTQVLSAVDAYLEQHRAPELDEVLK
jgi:hypothetical protein